MVAGALQIRTGIGAIQQYGQFYTAAVWDRPSVIAWARELGEAGGPLPYSNEPELLYLRTGRPAYRMPRLGASLTEFARAFADRPRPIILIRPLRPNDFPASALPAELRLRTLMSAPEGIVMVPAADASR